MAKSVEIRLGQHLIRKRLSSLRQVNEAFLAQRKLREQGTIKSLGSILMQKGYIDEERLREALGEIGVGVLKCPSCHELNPIASYAQGSEHRCPHCRCSIVVQDQVSEKNFRKTMPASSARSESPATDPGDAMISKIIGGCQILEQIARGGMGVVYRARQLNLGRTVALKILSEELSTDKTYVERFIQEARSAAVLSHGNIVHVNDVGDHNGMFYFIMEYIDGENLREILIKEGSLDVDRALEITLQVACALQHAHRRGIIHRDIKPENIMITREGSVKLADMGLAKRIASRDLCGITNTGSIFGTPYYMAPEQAKDFSKVDRRSDIYSLGVTLYKALTAKVPYDGRSPIEVMVKTLEGKHALLRELRPEIPKEVEDLVERMISRNPGDRFQEAGDLIAAIKSLPQYHPTPVLPSSP